MKIINETIQEESSDCGICCLETIIKYYGGYIPLEKLRINTNTDMKGCSAFDLIQYAKKIGFNAIGKNINKIDEKYKLNAPYMAHLKLKNGLYHFVVIYKISKNYIYIMDPAIGKTKKTIEDFNTEFTGVILIFEPINDIPHYKKNTYLNKIIKKEILSNKRYKYIILLNIILLLFSFLLNFEINILNQNIHYFYLLIFIIVLNEILLLYKNILFIKLSNKFNKYMIIDYIKFVFSLPLKYLKIKRSGEIQTRFSELNELSNNFIALIFDLLFDTITILIIISIFHIINIKLFIPIIIISIVYIIFNIFVYKKLLTYIRYSIILEESYNSNIIEYIKYIETIKNINKYDYFINNVNDSLFNKNYINEKLNKKIYFINMIDNLFINIFMLTMLFMIHINNYNSVISLSTFILASYFINNIKKIISYYPVLLTYKTVINKNNDFLSCEIEKNKIIIKDFRLINLKNVSYNINTNNILKNINITIKNKDKIFIFGNSGSGKTTLMRILKKENTNYTGTIFIDNNNLKESDISELITYTGQNEFLFDDTLLNNITLKEEIDKVYLDKIIKICRLDSIIKDKSLGLNSEIINSSNISGGEKNRIILARSLIHSKQIIILDEVLKEVEKSLEVKILKDILKEFRDKTIIYISHKNVSYLFDKTFYFKKGEYNGY